MKDDTLWTDSALTDESDRRSPAVGTALPRAKDQGTASGKRTGPTRESGDDALRAARERDAADGRGAAETAVLGAVASSMVLGALYPKDLKAETAKDHPNPHGEEARDMRAAAQGADDHPTGVASEAPFDRAAPASPAGGSHSVAQGAPDASAAEAPHIAQQPVEPPQGGGMPVAIAGTSHEVAPGAQSSQESHVLGQAPTSAPGSSAQPDAVDHSAGPTTDASAIVQSLMEQAAAFAVAGRLPPAVGLPNLLGASFEPGGHDGGSIPAAVMAGTTHLDALTAPVADAEAAVTSRIGEGVATAVPTVLGAADALVHATLDGSLSHTVDALNLTAPLTGSFLGTAAALPDAVAAATPLVGTLTETLTGSLEHGLPGLASVAGTAAALPDAVAAATPLVGTLTETLTGSLEHGLPGLASVAGTATALPDAVAAVAPVVGTLTETLTGSLEHGLPGFASVAGTAAALPDPVAAVAPVGGTLTEILTGSLEHGLSGVVSSPATLPPDGVGSDLPLVGSTVSTAQEMPSSLVETIDRTVSHVDDGAHTALATTESLLSGDVGGAASHGVPALASSLTEHVVEAASIGNLDPISTVVQVQDAPSHTESPIDQGPVATLADATGLSEHSATAVTAGALHDVSSVLGSLAPAGSGQHGTTAVAEDAASSMDGQAGHSGVTALASAITEHAVEAAPNHAADPVSTVTQVLEAPAHTESHAGSGSIDPGANAASPAEHAAATTSGALHEVSSAVTSLVSGTAAPHGTTAAEEAAPARTASAGEGHAATTAEPAVEHASALTSADATQSTTAEAASHIGNAPVVESVGAAVGSAVGGTINLGSSHAEPSQSHDASAAPASSAAGSAPADAGHADVGSHAVEVAHAAPEAVVAPPVHVGFAGLSYTENVDSHEHGLASANGMLHGLV